MKTTGFTFFVLRTKSTQQRHRGFLHYDIWSTALYAEDSGKMSGESGKYSVDPSGILARAFVSIESL